MSRASDAASLAPTPAETHPADHPAASCPLPPIEDRLHDIWSKQREPQDSADVGRVDPLRPGQVLHVAYSPASSSFRLRNARASGFTIALSTRGRVAHGAPSGVTICFRPPRFRNVIGIWTVMVSPSAETVARWRHPAALGLAATSRTSPDSPLGRRRTSASAIRTSTRSISCLRDPSLLGRKQLVPQRIELQVCSARLADRFAPESRKGRSLPEPCRP